MKIIIASAKPEVYKLELEIHHCIYNNQTERWEVPCAEYDNFTSYVCPHLIKPLNISFSYDQAYITVGNREEASLLGEWLRDADRKAKESFKKMPG